MNKKLGIFTISLDFELYWGMRDVISVEGYSKHLDGTPKAVELMLKLFNEQDIHATWATMGFLFCKDVDELKRNYPEKLPEYRDDEINLYKYAQTEYLKPEYHFAPKSIELISSYPNQEVASHTFSHYYCLEEGQDEEAFYEDIMAFNTVAKSKGITPCSLVFPRNQYNKSYIEVIKKAGITSYRGNERGSIYDAASEEEKKTLTKRLLRIVDTYINISGYHTYKLEDIKKDTPFNIPASRFLRPYSLKLSFLDSLKLKRITDAMTYAAKNGELYHLWWHPHNFGINTKENMVFLEKVIKHYKFLEKEYGFRTLTMEEISKTL
jgi:peptidoglycan/xylan/chitin deacetylase (PgdA/CDA1 family)